MPKTYFWLLFAAIAWVVTYLLVPREKIRRLIGIGFWGGLVLTVVIQVLAIAVLGLWKFNYMLLPILGFPLFLLLMWFAETILFVNFLPEGTNARIVYITAFAASNTLIGYYINAYGFQTFIRWNLLYTFLLAMATHLGIAYFYLVIRNRVKR